MSTWYFRLIESQGSNSAIEELCKELLPDDYEIHKAPTDKGKPIKIYTGFQVLDIGEVNEETMDFRIHVFIMNVWNDTRLKLDAYKNKNRPSILYEKCRAFIWIPDIFYESAKSIETYEPKTPSTIFKVFPDGALILSRRFSFKADCHMDLENYPFDTQICHFLISLLFSSDSVARLKWIGEKESPYRDQIDSIRIMRKVELMQFYLLDPEVHSFTKVMAEGNYTSLVADFTIVRLLIGPIMNIYIPSTMIVGMSWVSFWLGVDAVPGRVALSVTSLLTLCTQVEQSKSQLPPVNYIKAIDIWLFVCIIMVFSTLLEFAISYNIHKKKCENCSKQPRSTSKTGKVQKITNKLRVKSEGRPGVVPWNLSNNDIQLVKTTRNEFLMCGAKDKICPRCYENHLRGERVDSFCKIIFPSSFCIFTIIYWVYYMNIYDGS